MDTTLHSSAMAARQLIIPFMTHGPVVPTMSIPTENHPFTLGHGPVIFSAPTPVGVSSVAGRPFTLGHEPIQSQEPTAATTLLVEGRPFTLQHGPVVVSTSVRPPNIRRKYVESVMPTAASHFATVVKESPTTNLARPTSLPENDSSPGVKNNPDGGHYTGWFSRAWEWAKGLTGLNENHNNDSKDNFPKVVHESIKWPGPWGDWKPTAYTDDVTAENTVETAPGSSRYMVTDCHPDNGDYIYFTVLSPDGTLARDSRGEKALYYVKTSWTLTYPKDLHKTLFNDPDGYPACPNGHCISKMIPGTNLRIRHVRSPSLFRAGWQDGHCGYVDDLLKVNKLAVQLGAFGFLWKGGRPHIPVVEFVEQQMLTTYPKLEMGLICGFAIGLLPGLYLLYWLAKSLVYTWAALETISRATSSRAKKCARKVQNVVWRRTEKLKIDL